ncbi:MAG: NAD(P)-dependent oxidoreductase [Candidatus Marinimicrobia bacterium]|nr:NAD(P)-dependent oxidoreductase [Candidatus Neomarinimicrobiota bacterium]
MHVLVTGATGFIGKHIVPRLLREHHSVRCLTRPNSHRPAAFENDVEWIIGDLSDLGSLDRACSSIDLVIHLAGITKSIYPDNFFQINTTGTENLINAAREGTRIIYISSQAAVGPSKNLTPLYEQAPANPVSDYGRSKQMAEQLFLHTDRPINFTIIRPAIVYGPEDRESLSLFRIAKNHINPRIGIRKSLINIIHINDLVEFIMTCIDNNLSNGEIFNLNDGNNAGYTQSGLITTAAKYLDSWTIPLYVPQIALKFGISLNSFISRIRRKTSMLNPDKYNELTARGWVLSSQKARDILGYRPQYDIDSGFQMTINWYRENQWL